MDDEARDDEAPPLECEAADEEEETRGEGPVNDERTLEEAGYGYGV